MTEATDILGGGTPEVGASRHMHQILAGVKNWAGFQEIAATLGPKDKGDLFELLTKHFLLLNPTYNTNLSDVWLLKEVPEKLRARLQLPEDDKGSDYKIITMAISHKEIDQIVAENRYLRPKGAQWEEEVEAQMLASLVALRKAMLKHKIKHAVSFHKTIERAETFREFNDLYTNAISEGGELETFHVKGTTPSGIRKRITAEFASADRSLITNARCLTEGVDIPNIDCVLFADPKRSTVDIVQAVGRALRPAKGKRYGYVLVPVIAGDEDGAEFVESEAFAPVLKILRALAGNDERIIEWFRARNAGRKPKGRVIEIEIDEKIAESIDLQDFASKIEIKIWSRLER